MKKETKIMAVTIILIVVILGLTIWFYLIPELDKKNQKPIKLRDDQKLTATLLKMSETYFKENELYDTDNLSLLKLDSVKYLGKKDHILTYSVIFKARCLKKKDRACLYFPVQDKIDYTKRFDYSGFLRIKEENNSYTLFEFDDDSRVSSDSIFPENIVSNVFENYMREQYELTLFQVESAKFLKFSKQPIYEIKGTYQCKDSKKECLSNQTENHFDLIVGAKKENNEVFIDFVDSRTNYEIIK